MLNRRYIDLIRKAMRSRTRRYFAMLLAGIITFTTTYALILPALTLEDQNAAKIPGMKVAKAEVLDCRMPVHQHDESCYKTVKGEKTLVCGQADYVIHTHDANCYDKDGNLVCQLPEVKAGDEGIAEEHTHSLSCYETGPNGEDALQMGWVTENSDGSLSGGEEHLICDKIEVRAHQHDADCFREVENPDGEDNPAKD